MEVIMGKARSPNRDKAFEIYKENNGKIKPKEIAEILNESVANISSWKNRDKWSEKVNIKKSTNKRGGQKGNLNNLRHGLYCDETKRLPEEFIKKYFPTKMKNVYNDLSNIGLTKLEMLGISIDSLWARISVSPKITEVKNKNDMTKVLKRTKDSQSTNGDSKEREYEIQHAWDKENNALDSYSKSLERLSNMIEKYEKLLHANWDLATEEQRLRIEKLRAEVAKADKGLNNELKIVIDYGDADGSS